MKTYEHPEEQYQTFHLISYALHTPDALYEIMYADGEMYKAVFSGAYNSENGGELDIDENDPLYDEFEIADFDIVEIIQDGSRRYNEFLSIDYRDFPQKIIDLTYEKIVYIDVDYFVD